MDKERLVEAGSLDKVILVITEVAALEDKLPAIFRSLINRALANAATHTEPQILKAARLFRHEC